MLEKSSDKVRDPRPCATDARAEVRRYPSVPRVQEEHACLLPEAVVKMHDLSLMSREHSLICREHSRGRAWAAGVIRKRSSRALNTDTSPRALNTDTCTIRIEGDVGIGDQSSPGAKGVLVMLPAPPVQCQLSKGIAEPRNLGAVESAEIAWLAVASDAPRPAAWKLLSSACACCLSAALIRSAT